MGLLLGDVHLSELERLDKPCATVGRELVIIRFAVNDTSHSAISSPELSQNVHILYLKNTLKSQTINLYNLKKSNHISVQNRINKKNLVHINSLKIRKRFW